MAAMNRVQQTAVYCSMSHISLYFFETYFYAVGGTRCRSWLRHYATSQKVAGSIPDVVFEFFQ
jgi:hypothetical protein